MKGHTMAWPENVTRKDIRIDFYRGSGKGGQHRNKADTACRMTHLPTGISACAEEQRKQGQNKTMAFRRLANKLVPLMRAAIARERGDLSEPCTDRIRTYHERRGTVVDHRVPGVVFNYKKILDGELTSLIAALASLISWAGVVSAACTTNAEDRAKSITTTKTPSFLNILSPFFYEFS